MSMHRYPAPAPHGSAADRAMSYALAVGEGKVFMTSNDNVSVRSLVCAVGLKP